MIKLVVFDFDGVFTDGTITYDSNGEIVKKYNCKDGMGLKLLKNMRIKVGVISGYKENNSQKKILEHLDIPFIKLNIDDKLYTLNSWCVDLSLNLNEVAYMGDDLNDLSVIKNVGFSGCPLDACEEVKKICNFVSNKRGGEGCVREFCEYVIKRENKHKTMAGLICVKYNSKRLPFKNFRKFGNTTLLDIKIERLLKLDFLDSVIVNTESEYIMDYVLKKYNNTKLKIVKRESLYANDQTDNREFSRNVVSNIKETYVCYSPVTMPFISEETYKEGFKILCENEYDTIILNADGKQGGGHLHEKHKICFGFSMIKRDDVIKYGDFIAERPYYMVCNERERMDIDYPEEFKMCLYHYFNKDAKNGFENKDSLDINSLYDLKEMSPIGQFEEKMEPKMEQQKQVGVIDVTIRDGGFDNKWNWDKEQVKRMLECSSETGIEYFEIGYLANENILKSGDGHYRNVSFNTIKEIVDEIKPKCKISVLFDAWRYDTHKMPMQENSSVDLVRVVSYMDKEKLLYALKQCERVKNKNYKVSLNIMCASYFTESILNDLIKIIKDKIEILDYLYLADSYGGMEPKQVDYVFNNIKRLKIENQNLKLGFHIHNNGQIGMANMISSLEHVDIIDASFHGMGRGMGNVRLEDVILFLKIKRKYELNIEPFLNYLSGSEDKNIKEEIKNTILGFLNIHPYRIRDFKDEKSLYKLYLQLKELSFEKKYDYLI
jgi:3-deoxy-D-manno-octulosonate 8-phosphate phosphatase (KDO 8-P phosphatase)